MEFKYFSHNGELRPIVDAVVPLSNIEYQYGFGVYETIRVANGVIYFVDDHIERLLESARIIALEHPFDAPFVEKAIRDLVSKNEITTCNLKILLIGAPTPDKVSLSIQCLNPLFPPDSLYRDGAKCITYTYERAFPHAKTLNMLQSYLAYRSAKAGGAYDALLINRNGEITEGTRTNFFCIRGKTLYSPPEDEILLGVTQKALFRVASLNGYTIEHTTIKPADVSSYDGAFLTSTSTKILPIRSIEDVLLQHQPLALKDLMGYFKRFLEENKGSLR